MYTQAQGIRMLGAEFVATEKDVVFGIKADRVCAQQVQHMIAPDGGKRICHARRVDGLGGFAHQPEDDTSISGMPPAGGAQRAEELDAHAGNRLQHAGLL